MIGVTTMKKIVRLRSLAVAAGAVAVWAGAFVAASSAPAPKPPAENAAPGSEQKPEQKSGSAPTGAKPAPSLDDLLGIPRDERPADSRPIDDPGMIDPLEADPDRAALERALTATEASQMFRQAVRQMGDVADLLQVAGDPGVTTQRIQEEILRKLDTLIKAAEQQSSSSSSSQGSQQQQQQSKQQQAAAQPQPADGSQQQQGDNQMEGTPPGGQEGALADVLDAARAAWGSLPDRVRDTLFEVRSDQFSSMYRALTEEYYRRLAEEPAER